ncbi:hypothetical protein F4861DRAFT_73665 [Xylaria intraflava]|nr:hypothetical protein F4861DRAFT_73665 [Xylaria intraflava]
MPGTGDNAPYAPKSPDLSSIYFGPDASSGLNYHYLPNSGSPYHSLQPPAQTQIPTQALAQAQAQAQAQTLAQLQFQSHHYTDNFNSSDNGSTATATATATATTSIANQNHNQNHNHNHHNHHNNNHNHNHHSRNHNSYPLPAHQQPSFATYDNNSSLSPYFQSGVRYYPQARPQYQQPPHHPTYQPHVTSAYQPPATDSPASTDSLPASQSFVPRQYSQPLQRQQPSPPISNKPTTPSFHSNTMPRGKAAVQAVKEPEIMESPVRTKFPTARIKRIMQADEEVGKVAQQTPIAVGKALELFMVQLVQKSADVAKDKGSKRITAPMLKQAIDSTNEWDFLRDIVAKVTEDKEGFKSGRHKADSDSDDDADAVEVKRRGRGGRRKKTAA